MDRIKRWVILLHTNDPRDHNRAHYDFLFEDAGDCKSWKLNKIPHLGGPSNRAIPGPSHKLIWLEREEAEVSNNRGTAKRLLKGFFKGVLPNSSNEALQVILLKGDLEGHLTIHKNKCELKPL